MLDRIHDEIDAREELREKAKALAESVVRKNLDAAINDEELNPDHDIPRALEILAAMLANELADLTSEAVRSGFLLARNRNG
jgi:hypothetical protein